MLVHVTLPVTLPALAKVKGSSYKYYNPIYSDYRQSRITMNMHGISIQAIPGGTYREFDFNNLLIQLTTSLTLFAVATVIVDFVALYVLPDKEIYDNYKYEKTEDFSDRRAAQAADLEPDQWPPGMEPERRDSRGVSLPTDGSGGGFAYEPLVQPSNQRPSASEI